MKEYVKFYSLYTDSNTRYCSTIKVTPKIYIYNATPSGFIVVDEL